MHEIDDNTYALSSSLHTGLLADLKFLIDISELRPTIKISPFDLACSRINTCPEWMISKHPLVKTIDLSLALSLSTKDNNVEISSIILGFFNFIMDITFTNTDSSKVLYR